jgi:hypothetical protein
MPLLPTAAMRPAATTGCWQACGEAVAGPDATCERGSDDALLLGRQIVGLNMPAMGS